MDPKTLLNPEGGPAPASYFQTSDPSKRENRFLFDKQLAMSDNGYHFGKPTHDNTLFETEP